MRVYLSEDIDPDALALLRAHAEVVDTLERPEELDAIIVRRVVVDADTIRRASRCKVIAMHGVGTDTIDVAAAERAGIPVVNVPEASTESVAEMGVALILNVARHVNEAQAGLREGRYDHFAPSECFGCEIYGKKIGFLGFGHIARRMAEIMRAAFSCKVLAWSRSLTDDAAAAAGARRARGVDELMRESDILSVNVPLTAQTRGMVGARELAIAKPGQILVSTARGGVVDEGALAAALAGGRLGGAGLDVTEVEPLPASSPLLMSGNFVCTPHLGGSTREARRRVGMLTVENVLSACGIDAKDDARVAGRARLSAGSRASTGPRGAASPRPSAALRPAVDLRLAGLKGEAAR